MPARTFPNVGLKGGYDEHEGGWADDQNLNLLKLSALAQGTVISKLSATPGSPTPPAVYLFDETHATNPNTIGIFEGPVGEETWTYIEPEAGWLVYNQQDEYYEKFDGTVWAELETGGGAGFSVVTPVAGTSHDLLASEAGLYLRFTSDSAKTVTVQNDATEPMPANGEWHIRNTGAADIELVEDTAVTINPPNGGTLFIPQGGTVTLKRVAVDEYDLLGQTVAA